jgi:hypothetical protein
MLSKCANPHCSAPFLYLHQGKLFRFDFEAEESNPALGFGKEPRRRTEYFWLCDSCTAVMTLECHKGTGVVTVSSVELKAAS